MKYFKKLMRLALRNREETKDGSKRKGGFYWVKFLNDEEWTVGKWVAPNEHWRLPGHYQAFLDYDLEIGKRISEPKESE